MIIFDIFLFFIIFIPLFIFSFGIFDIFAPEVLFRYKHINIVIIVICFIGTIIIIEMSKIVDVDTCKERLQENFHISFKDVEIDSCKIDGNWDEDVLYAEIKSNQIFFNELSNNYKFSSHKGRINYPTNFNIHEKKLYDDLDLNLIHEHEEDYGDDVAINIIGCNSKTFICSFYSQYIDLDGTF